MTGTRKDQWDTTVVVDGRQLGTWDVQTGGEVDSAETIWKPGGMGQQISLGGTTTIGQVVLSRLFQLDRDALTLKWLLSRVGRGAMVVNKQALDADGNAAGVRYTYQGI